MAENQAIENLEPQMPQADNRLMLLAKLHEISVMVAKDCEQDANTLDGLPFNGKVVAERLGQIYAMIKACAETNVRLCDLMRGL